MKRNFFTVRKIVYFSLFTIFFSGFLISSLYKTTADKYPLAAKFKVEKMTMNNDIFFDHKLRNRQTWIVTTEATDKEVLIETSKAAAEHLQITRGMDVVQVYLTFPDDFENGCVSTFYAADGGGNSGEDTWTWQINEMVDLCHKYKKI